ncbi:kinase-like domain-containing protein [Aspergillus varians]
MNKFVRDQNLGTTLKIISRYIDLQPVGTGAFGLPVAVKKIMTPFDLLDINLHKLLTSRPLENIQRRLKYIHSTGIVHRDLKPSNILINENCNLNIYTTVHQRSCSHGEMLERKPLFPGKRHVNQFSLITEILGTSPEDVIQTICSENALADEYLAPYHDPTDEPEGEKFDWSFDDADLPVDTWKTMM